MTRTSATICHGCGHSKCSAEYRIARQPVVLNYRFPTAAAATRVRRKDLRLLQCQRCGLVFNAAFDPALIPYDSKYENRQCFSPAFQQHLTLLADDLIRRHQLNGSSLLEVGCGKGDFLRLLCARAHAQGVGYDTSYEGVTGRMREGAKFFRRYVTADDIDQPHDAIICRHVVEHIGEIGIFLRELHDIAAACGDPVVVIETPSFEWIAKHRCFWDLFYEHCNYFTLPCLAHLCERAGFTVAGHRLAFGSQYQVLELKVRRGAEPILRRPKIPARLDVFARQAEGQLKTLAGSISLG